MDHRPNSVTRFFTIQNQILSHVIARMTWWLDWCMTKLWEVAVKAVFTVLICLIDHGRQVRQLDSVPSSRTSHKPLALGRILRGCNKPGMIKLDSPTWADRWAPVTVSWAHQTVPPTQWALVSYNHSGFLSPAFLW